ncbi:MAG: ABC transporter transmembrane domain-containing protein [Panacagrimonas sp.]
MSETDTTPAASDPMPVLDLLDEAPAKASRKLHSLSALWRFLRPYRMRLLAAFVLLCIGSATMLAVPLALRDLIDHGFVADANVNPHFISLFAIALFWGLAVAGRFYFVSWIGERVSADLRSAIYSRMLAQSPEYFETTRTGEVLSRLTADTTLVQTVVGSSISMGLRSGFQFLGGLIMMAVTSFKLFAVTVVLLALVVAPIVLLGRALRKLSRLSQDRIADTAAVAGEMLNAIPTVQAFTKENDERKRFDQAVEHSFDTAIRRTRMRAVMTAGIIAGVFGAIVFVLWLGAQAVIGGTMSAGQLAAFVFYALLAAGGVGVIAEVWGEIMRAAGATERLMELLAATPSIQTPGQPRPLPARTRAQIGFENLSFSYPSRPQIKALSEINLQVNEGETLALVGPSGAGKTTLFQLLLRFYEADAGRIVFNGEDLRQLDPIGLREQIGIVAQDPVIFSANAMENIRFGRAAASDEEVMDASRTALADAFIRQLPQAYNTFLGERGTRLSGGQKQRIAIARAILRDPPLLLLDEATSALDAESEALVQAGLEAAMKGRTTIIIAHRLSTVQRADRVVVLEQGRIVEDGAPTELIMQGGLYARMANLQLVA